MQEAHILAFKEDSGEIIIDLGMPADFGLEGEFKSLNFNLSEYQITLWLIGEFMDHEISGLMDGVMDYLRDIEGR